MAPNPSLESESGAKPSPHWPALPEVSQPHGRASAPSSTSLPSPPARVCGLVFLLLQSSKTVTGEYKVGGECRGTRLLLGSGVMVHRGLLMGGISAWTSLGPHHQSLSRCPHWPRGAAVPAGAPGVGTRSTTLWSSAVMTTPSCP